VTVCAHALDSMSQTNTTANLMRCPGQQRRCRHGGPAIRETPEEFRAVIDINLNCSREVFPDTRE
jgi:hypothetical protein